MSRLRREDHPGLTDDQFERTDARLGCIICMNIDWLCECGRRGQQAVDDMVGTYEMLALNQSHNA